MNTYKIVLFLHILSGMAALASGFSSMISRKGLAKHLISGRVYFWSMTFSCLTAVIMSTLKPNPFLFIIGIFSYQFVAVGYRYIKVKKIYTGKLSPELIDWTIGLAPVGILLAYYSWTLYSNINQPELEIVNTILSSVIVLNSVKWIRDFYIKKDEKKHWLLGHMGSMGGAYIATSTAFIVTNFSFLPNLLTWLTPPLIGSIILSVVVYKHRKRFRIHS